MKNSNFKSFAILAGVLVLLFIFARSGSKSSSDSLVFANFDWTKVAKIGIEKGGEKVEVSKLTDEKWIVPARDSYTANGSEITSILLKLADLSASQKINLNEDGLKRLGLNEASKDSGQGVITLFDSEGKELDKVFIGGLRNRKNAGADDTTNLAGQYVKRNSSVDSYLVPTPVVIYPTITNWLEDKIMSVSDSDVVSVSSSFDSKVVFTLVKDEKGENLVYKGTAPEGKLLQATIVSQIASGLKDLKLSDVTKADSELAKSLNFSRTLVYKVASGLIYTVMVAEKDSKKYIKISVEFEKPVAVEAPKSDASPAPTVAIQESTTLEAAKLNSQFGPWVYEVPEHIALRLTKSLDDLFNAPKPPTPPAGAPQGMPFEMPGMPARN